MNTIFLTCIIFVTFEANVCIKLGFICDTRPSSWQYFFKQCGAVSIAIDALVRDEVIQNDTIQSVVWKSSQLQTDGVGHVVELVNQDDVDVIFGSPSSRITVPAAHLTSYWNFPHINWRSNSFDLSDKSLFKSLVRTVGPLSESSRVIVTLFQTFNWTKIGNIYVDYGLCLYTAMGIKTVFTEYNLTITQNIGYPPSTLLSNQEINDYLLLLKQISRIIYICVDFDLRRYLVAACDLGMCNGEYVFITAEVGQPATYLWRIGDDDDAKAKQAFQHLIFINTAPWFDEAGKAKLEIFSKEVIERAALPPWNNRYPLDNGVEPEAADDLYEAMYLYGLWLNHSKTYGINVRDGSALLEFSKKLSFAGIAGPCDMGTNGDRVPYFWVNQFVGPDVHAQTIAISRNKNANLKLLANFEWKTTYGRPPLDTPQCGILNELCPPLPDKDNTVAVVMSCLVTMLILTATVTIGYTIRKRKLETNLLESIWKVTLKDIDLQKAKFGFGSKANMRSQSALSHFSSESNFVNQMRLYSTNVAIYRGQTVAVRNVRNGVVLTKMDLHKLKTMREMMHDNINPFLGACFDQPSACVLFLYCPKGSLQGMHCIHSSKLEFHGRLKSTNCLVDNRWMLKVTDYGIANYIPNMETKNEEEHQKYRGLLWTAPELLLDCTLSGSKAGDVYSFGIVMHEIFYRMGTFAGVGHLNAKDIVNSVKANEAVPCRPHIFTDDDSVTPAVCKLMQSCWDDDPTIRPTFSVIRSYIKKNIQLGESLNIVDVILQRLEKYASNLEDLVGQRTQQLMQEKEKSDRLLYRMLPKTCADKLKRGEIVPPDIFEAATVFFSDIVGFTTIAGRSTPMQVVDLLNDLYTCFDDIINKYDAYKVETIGDAYLVVSGIPTRNGDSHAAVIADMSLDILAGVKVFTIKHMPEEDVQVRIGCNTGPCCAGVVGLSMPRYCLFGDTVNTANRMESNGAAQKIHLSEATHLALQKIGGYTTLFRANMPIKGKGFMNTYWLEGKECRSMANTDFDAI